MRSPHLTLAMLLGLGWGCGDGASSAPSPLPPPAGAELAVFRETGSDFSTTDVRDADGEIVRFDTTSDTLIWTPTNLVFQGWPVDGTFLDAGRLYQVRFGTESGERRAYFTESGRGTLCDLRVEGATLRILPTDLLPPAS